MNANYNQNYIMDKLTLSDLKTTGKVIIPPFQRGIVWSKEHRKEFIETVKTGDPFGVVLVSQEKNGDPYYLIDGLQRLSTLKAYMSNPLEFIDENDKFINLELLHNFYENYYKSLGLQLPKEEKLNKEKKSFLKKFINILKSYESIPDGDDLWPVLCEQLGFSETNFPLFQTFSKFYKNFIKNLQLPDIIIHAIVYTGPKDRLPTVFENLNTSSVTLSKYEIFSSQWPLVYTQINDEDIIKYVWKKYKDLKTSSSFDVETTEEKIRNVGITLFEYCFALSELLNDKEASYSYLFNKEKKTTDPIGFDVLSLICGLGVNKADLLYKDEYLGKSSGMFLITLKNAIINTIEYVSNVLRPWVFDLKGSCIKNNSTYQIYHLVVNTFNHLYDFNSKEKYIHLKDEKEINEWKSKFEKFAHKWYLYHILKGFWNENRQVSDLRRLLDEDEGKNMYIYNVSKEQWDEVLRLFLEQQKNTNITRNIDSSSKLILNYLYRLLLNEDYNRKKYFQKSSDSDNEVYFDIEHIVVYDVFKSFKDKLGIVDIPSSAIGNLCYLPVKDNRSKRNKTIYQYSEDRPSLTYNEEFLALIDYPSREDLMFTEYSINEFKEAYSNFLDKRESKLVLKFENLIMKD